MRPDPTAVAVGMDRLRAISRALADVNGVREDLYEERRRIVHELRGAVPQVRLAEACSCGVDMIKNIVRHAPNGVAR